MSVTKHLVCTSCEKRLWVGQNNTLYSGPSYLKALADFFMHHTTSHGETHKLLFIDEHLWADDPYYLYEEAPGGSE